ncbi:hypothetical protein, partial [Kitasatospora sp. NPDC093558]|uniref:hypothetical protein n=1 Tax=Kitasatospora sp. NPDC093558 TaxID=3155201 RepID=UPI00341E8320
VRSASMDGGATVRTTAGLGPAARAWLFASGHDTAGVIWPTLDGELCSAEVRSKETTPPPHCTAAKDLPDGRTPSLTLYVAWTKPLAPTAVYVVIADLETIERLRCDMEPMMMPEPLLSVSLPGGGVRTLYAVYPGGPAEGSMKATVIRDGVEAEDHVDLPQPIRIDGLLKTCDPIATPSGSTP